MVHFVRWDVDYIARLDWAVALFGSCRAVAAEDEDFVFVVVLVVRRTATGFDFEMSHIEIVGTFGRPDQHPHLRTNGTVHRDDFLLMIIYWLDFHFLEPFNS